MEILLSFKKKIGEKNIYIYFYRSIRGISFSDYGENYKTVNRLVPSPLYLDCTRRTEREKRV